MNCRIRNCRVLFGRALLALAALTPLGCGHVHGQSIANGETKPTAALIVDPDIVNFENVAKWKNEGFGSLVIVLDERFEPSIYQRALQATKAASIGIFYWVEVGRNPALANEHPDWMASLGSHEDWRRSFPKVAKLQKGEVAKAWPWTPIDYREVFEAQVTRIKELLKPIPADYRGLLLNDLQGGPSSCGCGNLQCRWAIDYGVAATTEELTGHDVAARFVLEVEKLVPEKDVVPVWTIECEQEDMSLKRQPDGAWSTGYCGDVDCFNNCLARFAEQWNGLHETHHGPTGVLLLHKEFQRGGKEYGRAASWVRYALRWLGQKELKPVPPKDLWIIVQGFDVSKEVETAARQAAAETGPGVVAVARTRILQSYEPRVVQVKSEDLDAKPQSEVPRR